MRTSFTLPQVTVPMADWAAKNGIKTVVTFVADYGPGLDAEKFFKSQFTLDGGKIIDSIRTPLRAPDFAPFLQKVADLKPDAVFVFLPSGQGAAFMKQFGERGLDKSGIKLIATGDVTDDDQLNDMGDVGARRRQLAPLLGGASVGAEQEVRRRLRGGQQVPAQLHGRRRLRRHAPDLQRARRDQGQGRRRRAAGGDEGPDLREPARPDPDRRADARHRAGHLHPQGRARAGDGQQLYNVEFDVQKAVKDPGKAK